MNVRADVSHQVLDRIKGSSERLDQALNQPGIDRCYKGDPMVRLGYPQTEYPGPEPLPVSKVEPHPSEEERVTADATEEIVELEVVKSADFAEPVSPLQSHYPAEQLEQEWKQMLQDVKQLQEESAGSRVVLDEVRVEMGKVAVYSRREVVRLGKRLDALEQAEANIGAVEPPSYESLDLSENTYLKEQQQQMERVQKQLDQLQQQVAETEQQLQQQSATENTVEVSSEKSLSTSDGRERNIVEELRYEIGEVRKNSNRQLEALSSKLHALSTSSEVNQIVKHATTQLQQRIDEIAQKIE